MCCLRYEHETYEEAIRRTPSQGSVVSTKDGQGVVVETKPLAEEIKVKFTEKDKEIVKTYKCSDVKVISKKHHQPSKEDELDELPEELQETEEDREKDRRDEEREKKFDKIFNYITIGVFGAAAILIIVKLITTFLS